MNRILTHIPAWLKSKYLIAIAVFAFVLLFLDKNDIFTQVDRSKELKELKQGKEYYTRQIEAERKQLEALKNDPAALEKFAREKYLMKRDNEDLFLLSEKPDASNN